MGLYESIFFENHSREDAKLSLNTSQQRTKPIFSMFSNPIFKRTACLKILEKKTKQIHRMEARLCSPEVWQGTKQNTGERLTTSTWMG